MSVLEARGVSVVRGGRRILHDVGLRIESGEVTALAGPNGSGKSTLLRALAGIWTVSEGSVVLDEVPLQARSRRDVASRIAFVAQDTRIDFAFTVAEIVAMGRYPHRGRFDREAAADRQAVDEAMEWCGIASLRDRCANTLSGGERQRVVIARGLAVQPDFILLDEPTANLDIEHAIRILDLCAALARAGKVRCGRNSRFERGGALYIAGRADRLRTHRVLRHSRRSGQLPNSRKGFSGSRRAAPERATAPQSTCFIERIRNDSSYFGGIAVRHIAYMRRAESLCAVS